MIRAASSSDRTTGITGTSYTRSFAGDRDGGWEGPPCSVSADRDAAGEAASAGRLRVSEPACTGKGMISADTKTSALSYIISLISIN